MRPRTDRRVPLSSAASIEDYEWLIGPEASRWLDELKTSADVVERLGRLRKHLSAVRAHLIVEQCELRRRARQKFSAADRLFFTRIGLEQATDEVVARYKARRFPSQATCLDLCSGIGGDLMALAARGPTTGVERDRVTALLARENCRLCDAGRPIVADVRVQDAATIEPGETTTWHLDPDRRPTGRRTTRIETHEPPVNVITCMLANCSAAAIKLAPAAAVPELWSNAAELEWISHRGECRQLVAWFGRLAQAPGKRRATVVAAQAGGDELSSRTLVGNASPTLPIAAQIGRFVAEPDAAVLAAGLTATLADEHQLAALAPDIAYLTGDRSNADMALAWFEVVDVLPFDVRRVKALLRQRGIGRLEVKKRGVPHGPEQVRRQLRVPGDQAATLLLCRLRDQVTAILTRRCSPESSRQDVGSRPLTPDF